MTGATDTYVAGTKQLVEDSTRLGISWTLRPGTVTVASPLKVTFDGDDTPISAVSIIGVLTEGSRVMGLIVPPGGNFIVGFNDPTFTDRLPAPVNYSAVGSVGSTTSATYANIPNLPFVSLVKRFPASLTNISLIFSSSLSCSAINTGVGYGINLAGGVGTDVDLMTFGVNPASTHTYVTTAKLLTGLAPGTYTLTGRWKRTSGGATVQMDGGDWTSILAAEVWAV